MNKYLKNRKCTKCGNVGTTDVHSYEIIGMDNVSLWAMPSFEYDYDKPHIKRTCNNCEYSWWELPLDFEEVKNEK